MKHRITALILAMALFCAILPSAFITASAAETEGTCGENLTWSYDGATKTLTISGTGEMADYQWRTSPWYSFYDSIETLVFTEGITHIGASAFSGCDNLKSVTFSDTITTIGGYAFCGNNKLSDITIPNSVTEIGVQAFSYCTGLTSLTIPSSVKKIDSSAFSDCSGLTNVTLSNGLTDIEQYAFSHCKGLTSITIPATVTHIGWNAFYSCENMKRISVDEDNTSYSSDVQGVLYNKGKTELVFCPTAYSGSCIIPCSVTCINSQAFNSCIKLESVVIPNSVVKIDDDAFAYCSGLSELIIPDSVTELGEGAFSGCTGLKKLKLSANLTKISDYAFVSCSDLTSVTLPDHVTEIGIQAFSGCDSLTSITIPASVTQIDDSAFFLCPSLTEAFFCGNAPALGEYVFFTCDDNGDNYHIIPGLTLYYTEGAVGWTTPTWNGYATEIWKPESDSPRAFSDVKSGDWFYDAVNFAVSNNLFNGMGDNTFEPNTAMNRAMLVTVLWRYAGAPKEGTNTFTDVKSGAWYADAVSWASSKGIVNGVAAGKFDPNGNVTREQLTAILYRYCNTFGIKTDKRGNLSTFPDAAKVSTWAKDAYAWAVGKGLISGNRIDGRIMLDPQGNATRAQVAAILMRFIENP